MKIGFVSFSKFAEYSQCREALNSSGIDVLEELGALLCDRHIDDINDLPKFYSVSQLELNILFKALETNKPYYVINIEHPDLESIVDLSIFTGKLEKKALDYLLDKEELGNLNLNLNCQCFVIKIGTSIIIFTWARLCIGEPADDSELYEFLTFLKDSSGIKNPEELKILTI